MGAERVLEVNEGRSKKSWRVSFQTELNKKGGEYLKVSLIPKNKIKKKK